MPGGKKRGAGGKKKKKKAVKLFFFFFFLLVNSERQTGAPRLRRSATDREIRPICRKVRDSCVNRERLPNEFARFVPTLNAPALRSLFVNCSSRIGEERRLQYRFRLLAGAYCRRCVRTNCWIGS